jgi:uncharacterized membrane protein
MVAILRRSLFEITRLLMLVSADAATAAAAAAAKKEEHARQDKHLAITYFGGGLAVDSETALLVVHGTISHLSSTKLDQDLINDLITALKLAFNKGVEPNPAHSMTIHSAMSSVLARPERKDCVNLLRMAANGNPSVTDLWAAIRLRFPG